MKQIHSTLVHSHKEFPPARQILFEVIVRILKRLEPLLRKHIDHTLEVERHVFSIPNLSDKIAGNRVVHISDMHFHEHWEPEKMAEALLEKLKIIKAEAGDSQVVCVLSGDMLSKHTNFSAVKPHIVGFIHRFRDIFGRDARIYACEGNHDVHRKHWQEEKAFLQSLDIDYSKSSMCGGFHIVTTPDFTVDRVGAQEALQSSLETPSKDAVMQLVLSHNLEVLQHIDLPESQIPQIIMGGHTHNGHMGLISDPSFSDESDIVRRLMAFVLLGYRSPLVAGVKAVTKNIFASVSPGVGENENRPRFNSPRGLPVFILKKKA